MEPNQFLGIVTNGEFHQMLPEPGPGGPAQFTTISPQEAVSPDSRQLSLSQYEGNAVLIRGVDHGGWVFNATVVDCAGPIVTLLVQNLLSSKESIDQA